MKNSTKAIAAAVTTLTLLALGMSAASATGRGFGNGTGMGVGSGSVQGAGYGWARGRGTADGRGHCLASAAASGTLTDAQKSALVALAGEEKLAHDIYTTLAQRYPAVVQFARIAGAETRHQSALDGLIAKYELQDPNAGLALGAFASADRRAQYVSLLARATDAVAALAVGATIEQLDIADLAALLKTVKAPDVVQVLTNLDRASDMHLAAFSR